MADPEKQPEQPKAAPEKQIIGKRTHFRFYVLSNLRSNSKRTVRPAVAAMTTGRGHV